MNQNLTCDILFTQNKVVPVVVLNDINKSIDLANALKAGGISVIEVTLRTPNALQIIEKLANDVPDVTVGAGTVLSEDQYHMAIKHGAKFIVSPGLSDDLINVKCDYDAPFIPGCITPTEVLKASKAGFTHLKFFPSESYNGLSALKSMASVFPHVKFCPTGGITLDNAEKYLKLPNVAGIGCSFVVTDELVKNNQFDKITQLALQITNLATSL